MIRVLLYSRKREGPAQRLQRHIDAYPQLCTTETCHCIEDLSGKLRPVGSVVQEAILVLFATGSRDLCEFFSISELLKNARVILVLPDERQETVQAAHRLMPRYIGYADGDLSDVAAVMKKMIQHLNVKGILGFP